jgi:hypothetical protein
MDWVHGSWTGGAPGSMVDRSGTSTEAAMPHGRRTAHWAQGLTGGVGEGGQGEAGGRLTEAEPAAERRHDGAGDHDGGGFREVAEQALGRRGKRGGRCGERR